LRAAHKPEGGDVAKRTDASQNLQELRAFNVKHAARLDEWELRNIDRRWRSLGKAVRHPGALFNVKVYN
jgi:hypothetical protein